MVVGGKERNALVWREDGGGARCRAAGGARMMVAGAEVRCCSGGSCADAMVAGAEARCCSGVEALRRRWSRWRWHVAVAAAVRTKRCGSVDGGCRDWCVAGNDGSWWSETVAATVEVDGGG